MKSLTSIKTDDMTPGNSSDEPKTYSNFVLQQGSNICRVAVDKLSGFESVARHGSAVCISMRQDEVSRLRVPTQWCCL